MSADEAFEAGGRVLKPNYILRKPIALMDGAPAVADATTLALFDAG